MELRRLGKTELMVTPIGYGALGLPGVTAETLEQAVTGGMNFIDSARGYADSEIKIGKMLAKLGNRDKLILTTKSFSRDLKGFQANFETSLSNLGTDYIDIMFLHDVSTRKNWDLVRKNGLIDELNRLKDAGRIRHLGISTHDDGDVGREIIESGEFEVVMIAYNAANPELEETHIPLAKSLDLGIVIMKPYGGGVLTDKRSRELGFEMSAEEALKWTVSNPDVSCVIPGMDAHEYVDVALKVLNSDFVSLSKEELKATVEKVSIKGRNYCRGCRYCMPCPQGILIPESLKLNNRWEIYDKIEWAQMHRICEEFNETIPAEFGPELCTGCGACVQRCPYNLPIPELMIQCVTIKNHNGDHN
jgi:predicted aldo/keto reductase-like oxidoreductase